MLVQLVIEIEKVKVRPEELFVQVDIEIEKVIANLRGDLLL